MSKVKAAFFGFFKKKGRWISLSFLAFAATGVILAFQNCSRVREPAAVRGSRITLSEQTVFGDQALVSASSDSASQSLAVDSRGRPVIRLPDVPIDPNNCVNCGNILNNQSLPPETQIAPCERIICDTDPVRKPSECEEGTTFVAGNCVPKCDAGQIFINGECIKRTQSCVLEGGTGIQYWASNSFGACLARNCDASRGFRRDQNRCVPICAADEVYFQGTCHKLTQSCPVIHGSGQQAWNGTIYGSCIPVACETGYRPSGSSCIAICSGDQAFFNGTCYPTVKTCTVDNGSGKQTWIGSSYGPCLVDSCSDGFMSTGTSCTSKCTNDQIFANGQCNPRTTPCPILNGTGQQTWTGTGYGACQVTSCDQAHGYLQTGDHCQIRCNSEQIFENGVCRPIVVACSGPNGVGMVVDPKTNVHPPQGLVQFTKNGIVLTSPAFPDSCKPTACNPGYQISDNSCVSICPAGLVFINGSCQSTVTSCPIENGWGQMTWAGSSYGPCVAIGCGFGFEPSGNFCVTPEVDPNAWWDMNAGMNGGGGGGGGGGGDPLIVDLGNQGEKISLSSQLKGALFNLLGSFSTPTPNTKVMVSWTKNPRYRYLALPNSSGQILGIDQLFGDRTRGPDNLGARDGFVALRKYDGMSADGTVRLHDPDGFIDERDEIFSRLVLWSDLNGNGVSDPGETETLVDMGIQSIDLKYDGNFYEVDKWGNQTVFKSVVKFKDGRETLIFDLWFRYFVPVRPGCYTF